GAKKFRTGRSKQRGRQVVVRDRQQQRPQAPSNDDWDDDAEREEEAVEPLSHAEAVSLFGEKSLRPSRMTPGNVVLAQVLVTVLSAIGWALFASEQAASGWSALFGGAVCVIPSAIFALRLWMARGRPSVGSLVLGEAIKVFTTVALFVLVVVLYRDLH